MAFDAYPTLANIGFVTGGLGFFYKASDTIVRKLLRKCRQSRESAIPIYKAYNHEEAQHQDSGSQRDARDLVDVASRGELVFRTD